MTAPNLRPTTAMPLWVKVFLLIAVVIAVLFVGSALLGLQHGPGMHTSQSVPAPTAS